MKNTRWGYKLLCVVLSALLLSANLTVFATDIGGNTGSSLITSDEQDSAPGDIPEQNPSPSAEPTAAPTLEPSAEPTLEPSAEPTLEPTAEPSAEASASPTAEPSAEASASPTAEPSAEPIASSSPEASPSPEAPPALLSDTLNATGAFEVEGGELGTNYTYAGGVLMVYGGTLTIANTDPSTPTMDRIVVASTANITLAGVNINVSGQDERPAMQVMSGTLNLTLQKGRENTLVSGERCAGLQIRNAAVVINGEGALYAVGGYGGAGIGGEEQGSPLSITIAGGTINATGGGGGAGIGGGAYQIGAIDISISGGKIEAAGVYTVPIGLGIESEADSTVNITGGMFGAGNADASTVYGVAVAEGYEVQDSGNSGYPYAVMAELRALKVEGGELGKDYTYADGVLTVSTTKSLTISNTNKEEATTDRIVVNPDVSGTANITLNGVNIDVSGQEDTPAMHVTSGTLNLTLQEGSANTLKSGKRCAGLQIDGAAVIIDGTGTLKATGKEGGAGIGGGRMQAGTASVTIQGGMIEATSESYGAGIGGGSIQKGNVSVTIQGGTIKAKAGNCGAGIGGGWGQDGNVSVTIKNGNITANGQHAGIGGGFDQAGKVSVTIENGEIDALGVSGAGIGGGAGQTGAIDISISGGKIKAASQKAVPIGLGNNSAAALTVNITGGLFMEGNTTENTVYGASVAAGYSVRSGSDQYPYAVQQNDLTVEGGTLGEDYTYENGVLTVSTTKSLTISNTNKEKATTDRIVVTGTANITLNGVNIDVNQRDGTPAMQVTSGTLNLELKADSVNTLVSGFGCAGLQIEGAAVVINGEGTLKATSGLGGAGIGGGLMQKGNVSVTIKNGDITANGCDAGIGGGAAQEGKVSVTIENGTVNATGGAGASNGEGGAGIGGGQNQTGAITVSISGGKITAASKYAAHIGKGVESEVEPTVEPTVNITGGMFGAGDVDANTVYDIEPFAGYSVRSGSGEYPYAVQKDGLKVEGGVLDTDYTYANGVVTVKTTKSLTISNTENKATMDRIVVDPGADKTANITLNGVWIDVDGVKIDVNGNKVYDIPAMHVTSGTLNLTLAENSVNTLVAYGFCAGLQVEGAAVVIDGEGTLNATGETSSAGIGGGGRNQSGVVSVTILGGRINAAGSGGGAGIGGGENQAGKVSVTIKGGTINSTTNSGAGIGSGSNQSGETIVTILGGTINAEGTSYGAGIGGGYSQSGTIAVNIENGTVNATASGRGAGIGSGCGQTGEISVSISGGKITAACANSSAQPIGKGASAHSEPTVNITGGLFGAGDADASTVYGASVADGYAVEKTVDTKYPYTVVKQRPLTVKGGTLGEDYTYADGVLTVKTTKSLTISNTDKTKATKDTIVVNPGAGNTANITLNGVNIDVSRMNYTPAMRVTSGTLNLTLQKDSVNTLESGENFAGLQIENAAVVIKGEGTLNAMGMSGGAGIGGGYAQSGTVSVTIENGTINAMGERDGAGIGGGQGQGSAVSITVAGGTINATSMNGGAGIGGGQYRSEDGGGEVKISISGGKITAASTLGQPIGYGADVITNPRVNITGGMFAVGSVDANTVYGVAVAEGRMVQSTGDSNYPAQVVEQRDLKVEGGTPGTDYTYANGVLTVLTETALTISNTENTPTKDTIVVNPGAGNTANITLNGVNIDVSEQDGTPAMHVTSGTLNLTLQADSVNTLKSGYECAGLQIEGATVIISGEGTLNAEGDVGAGIGGGYEQNGDVSVIIESGTVNATGGEGSAGIGGGGDQRGDVSVTIKNGEITANGYDAGIGGGYWQTGTVTVTIENGTVKATSDGGGAGIGGGYEQNSNISVSISGGKITAEGADGADAIGKGAQSWVEPTVNITGGLFGAGNADANTVYDIPVATGYSVRDNADWDTKSDYPVLVKQDALTVEGGKLGEDYTYVGGIVTVKTETALTISNTDKTKATTDRIVVDPGENITANITLNGVNINVSGYYDTPTMHVKSGTLNLTLAENSVNTLKSGDYHAGLQIDGAAVIIDGTGKLEATGGFCGAGIGGGDGQMGDVSVTIKNGDITANGNDAGIGGGYEQEGEVFVTIENGTVKATSDGGGAGIGGGYEQNSNISVSISGGKITAEGADGADAIGKGTQSWVEPTVNITGGMFAVGNAEENTVYGIPVAAGYSVRSGSDQYPYAVQQNDLKVEGGTPGTDYTYANGVVTVLTDKALTISNTDKTKATTDRIVVDPGENITANITLNGVNIDVSTGAAMHVTSGTLNLTLAEDSVNTLVSGEECAGLQIEGAAVVIDGTGKLEATSEDYGAGIGGGAYQTGKVTVTIESGTIEANSTYAAGIGGGYGQKGNVSVTIKNGDITANGYDAGIGGGYQQEGNVSVTIENGTINATGGVGASEEDGGYGGAGIGGGEEQFGEISVSISGGKITAASKYAAPIGRGTVSEVKLTVNITGGLFKEGDAEENTVYDIEPLENHIVKNNPDTATVKDYPVGVYTVKEATLTLKNFETTYSGAAVKPEDLTLTAKYGETDGEATFDYSTGDSTWTAGLPTNAGTYTVRATLAEKMLPDGFYPAKNTTATLTVKKAAQAAPTGVKAENESAPGKNDGALTGLTTAMEYRLSGAAKWTQAPNGRLENLAPGTYEIRLAGDDNHEPGATASVIIAAGGVTPTAEPTADPSADPSAKPTADPSAKPTADPSAKPTADPSAKPTTAPTATPVPTPPTGDARGVWGWAALLALGAAGLAVLRKRKGN